MGLPPGIRPHRRAPACRLMLRDMRCIFDHDQGDSTRELGSAGAGIVAAADESRR
jgi:hypothetical protein